ncbi:unnamed protein product, partial [Effrenium voratum]
LVKLSQNSRGEIEYSSSSVVLCTEILKICISLVALARERPKLDLSWLDFLAYGFPALIYFVNNNLVFTTLSLLDTTTFQIVSQLKIVFTAILFRVLISRRLTMHQNLALVQLACGCAVSQLAVGGTRQSTRGFLAASLQPALSALGCVGNEKLFKDAKRENSCGSWG